MERSDYRFSRRDVRAYTGWGDTQLKIHLHRLEELEYLLIHRGGRGQSMVYELMFARPSDGGKPVLGGLIEVEKLGVERLTGNAYDEKKAGLKGQRTASSRPQVGGVPGWGPPGLSSMSIGLPDASGFEIAESTYLGANQNGHHVLTMAGGK